MDETSLKYYYDARAAARSIVRFAAGRSYEDYCRDEMLSAAIERKFEIIGEALMRIRRRRPEDLSVIGDWPAIIGFRNILVHAYEHIEDSLVWGIVTEQLPRFLVQLESIPEINSLSDLNPE
jgi:uncharacterized protein with HEPN domain